MSDGTWDNEYVKAELLENEITQYCKDNNIECPKFAEYARSWELKEILENLKKNVG